MPGKESEKKFSFSIYTFNYKSILGSSAFEKGENRIH